MVVQEVVLSGSHKLYPAVEPTRMMSLLEIVAKNKDICTLVGRWVLR